MPVHPACQPIATARAALEEARREAYEDLKQAIADGDIQGRQRAAKRAADLTREILKKTRELEACEIDHGARAPLAATFVGVAEFTGTHPDIAARVAADGPFRSGVRLALWFNALRTTVQITDFPEIPFKISQGLEVKVTMSAGGRGSYGAARGEISIDLSLLFDVTDVSVFFEEDAILPLTLYTAHPEGSVVDANGNVTLAGNGTFVRVRAGDVLPPQTLVGTEATIICRGKISPRP